MELLEFAKWNIHVKEEPDIVDSQQLSLESQADLGARDESWMCMFPNDVPVNSDAFANNPCGELPENIEVSLLNTYAQGNPVSQEAYTSDISTITTVNDERPDAITLLDQIFQEDAPNKEILPCEDSENRGQKETGGEQEFLLLQETAPKGQTQKRIDASSVGNELETTCSKYMEFEKKKDAVAKSKGHRSVEKPLCEEKQCVEVANSKETLLQETGINEKNNNSSEISDEATVNGHKVTRKRNADIGLPTIVEQSGFECPECGKMMKRFNGFVAHMKLHILHLQNTCVKCNICDMTFSSRKLQMLHKKKCRLSRAPKLPSNNQNLEINGNGKGVNAFENNLGDQKMHCEEWTESRPNVFHQGTKFPDHERKQDFENSLSGTQEKGNLMTSPTFTTNILTTNNCKEAWFSQIKSSEDQKRKTSKSIILSLRRFRFQKPKVVIEKMKLPLSRENTTTKLPSSSDAQLKGETQQKGETKLPSTRAAQQKSTINSLSLSESNNNCRIEGNVGRSLSTELSKLQSESNGNSKSLNDLSVIQSGVCKTTRPFSTEDVERVPVLPQQSKLKIRIKPIVVLDRVGFLENLEDKTTSSQGGKLKASASTSSKTQNESNQNFPALVKQFSLKKCFVKLSRLTDKDLKKYLSVKDCIYRIPEGENKERTCEKLKLLRTNSRVWKVTSAHSNRMNNDKITKDTPETIQKNSKTNNCRRRYRGTQKILSSHQKFAVRVRTQTPKYKCCGCKTTFHLLSELQLHVTKCSFSKIEIES